MPQKITQYKIFLASPSDLKEERMAIEEVIWELNLTYGKRNAIVLELLKWESHSVPGFSTFHPQELINEDLGQDYDLFIGMLWTKFGTPTANAGSGTEEEFNLAFKRASENPNSIKLLFYFKNTPKPLSEIDPDQLKKVLEFKQSLAEKNVLFGEFESLENFKQYLRMHIPTRIDDLKTPLSESVENSNEDFIYEDKNELFGLLDYEDSYIEFVESTSHSLNKISEATEWIGHEITKKAEELTKIQSVPNPNRQSLRLIFERVAKSMNEYTERIKLETPIFYSNFENAISTGIDFVNVLSDFNSEENISELENTKTAVFELKSGITSAISGMESFYEAINELPRIEKGLNIAKNRMSLELRSLITRLKDSMKLSEEFSRQIGDRIDQMKLAIQ